MKYCIPYSKKSKYKDKVDELIFPYDREKNIAIGKTLLDSGDLFSNQRVIIEILDYNFFTQWKTLEIFKELKIKKPELNFALKFCFKQFRGKDKAVYQELRESGIPFFFDYRANTWESFDALIQLGVSDIYVSEALGFELSKLGPVAHAAGISIRVFANVCQTILPWIDSLKSFFIRPEGVPSYEPYVDVIEFYGDTNVQDVMYKAYALDKQWFGPLKEIIIGLDSEIESPRLMRAFEVMRVRCGKKCLKGIKCNMCNEIAELSCTLKEKNLYIKDIN